MMYLSLKCFFLATFVFSNGFGKSALFTTDSFDMNVDEIACCKEKYVLSCHHISVNAENLGIQYLHLTSSLNETVEFQGMVGDSDHSYHYQNEKIDMVMTYNAAKGSLHGHATDDSTGASYVIDYCGSNGNYFHVLKQMDVDNMPTEKSVANENANVNDINFDDVADTTTIVTYTVKVYYTPEFRAVTADIDGWLDQQIQEVNQGYINSRVPLRVKLHCAELARVKEGYINDNNNALKDFEKLKGSFKALRGSADQAALFVTDFGEWCGMATGINTIASGKTVSVTRKSCAESTFTFGHELGHNIGLAHNREEGWINTYFNYGHGHLIARGSASRGYHTIMAYSRQGHGVEANYYSNPSVIYPRTRTPTGVSGISNNARVLTVQRFKLARIGDESESSCGGGGASQCQVNNVYRYKYEYKRIGRISSGSCKSRCTLDASCIGWIHHKRSRWCWSLQAKTTTANSYTSGPDLSKRECFLDTDSCTKWNTILEAPKYFKGSWSSSASGCHAACKQDNECVYWLHGGQNCYMYRAKYRSGYSGYNSGPRFC